MEEKGWNKRGNYLKGVGGVQTPWARGGATADGGSRLGRLEGRGAWTGLEENVFFASLIGGQCPILINSSRVAGRLTVWPVCSVLFG